MKKRVVFVTSDLYYVKAFLSRQIKLAAQRYDVTLIVNADPEEAARAIDYCGQVLNFSVSRKISLFRDLASLFRLIAFFIRHRPQVVHSTTPKAGMLAMLAARITGVRFRLHTFTGQVWQTRTGMMRKLLIATDRLTVACASLVLADSHGQLELLTEKGIVDAARAGVLGQGSICGVDPTRFMANSGTRADMRRQLQIPENTIIFLYMARFTVDKGAIAMADAFARLGKESNLPVHLLMVGPDEEDLTETIHGKLSGVAGKYSLINYTDTPERYFQCADVFCLPSYREGFPMVLLNAAAAELPVIASRIYGCTDAVVDGETGLLFEAGNIPAFCAHLHALAGSPELRERLGRNARERVEEHFTEEHVNRLLMDVYKTKTVASSQLPCIA
jgi:glycosyltransferase involved in cell wall biosynthesis